MFTMSCESPWDLDTPRNIILPKPVDSVQLSLVSIYIETNGTEEQFVIEKAILEIDSVSKTPIVWGTVSLITSENINFDTKKICLSSITLNLNNFSVVGNTVTLNNNSTPDSFAKYKINRGVNSGYDTTIVCDPSKNKAEISFSHDKDNNELWIYLNANIYEKRYAVDSGNTGNVISLPDSLFVKTRLHFSY